MKDEQVPEMPEKPADIRDKDRKRPPKEMTLQGRISKGPFATKEELWNEIDEVLVLLNERLIDGWNPIATHEIAAWLGVTLTEYVKVLNSSQFIRFMDSKLLRQAKMQSRLLDPIAFQRLRDMAERTIDPKTGKEIIDQKQDKDFLAAYQKRQEMLGIDKVELEDTTDLSEDEGNKLVAELSDILEQITGTRPNLYKILPKLLGVKSSGTKSGNGNGDTPTQSPIRDDVSLEVRPDPALDPISVAKEMPGSK